MEKIVITEADKDRALRNAISGMASAYRSKDPRASNRPLWSHVGYFFGMGSGYASALCKWAGVDPDIPCNRKAR